MEVVSAQIVAVRFRHRQGHTMSYLRYATPGRTREDLLGDFDTRDSERAGIGHTDTGMGRAGYGGTSPGNDDE